MAIEAETARLMLNWALWRSGSRFRVAVSGAYDQAIKDTYDTPMPLINGDAVEVEAAVEKLEEHQRKAVVEYWVTSNPMPDKARRCSCSVAALYRRLDQAHAFILAYRNELRARNERVRKAFSQSISESKREESRIIPLPCGIRATGED